MYTKINTRGGTVLILSALINDVLPLLTQVSDDLNHQDDEENLLCWLVDVFDESFEERYGAYSDELLAKLVLCVVNSRFYLIRDPEQFCLDFNAERLPVELGYDKTFYPRDQGHFIDAQEFVLLLVA